MFCIVKNRVTGGDKVVREFDFFTRIEIAIKARVITTGNLQAQRVTTEKHVASSPEIERYLIDLPRVHERGMLRRSTVTHAKNTFGKILREAVRRDVDQLRSEVGIDCGRLDKEIGSDRARNF